MRGVACECVWVREGGGGGGLGFTCGGIVEAGLAGVPIIGPLSTETFDLWPCPF